MDIKKPSTSLKAIVQKKKDSKKITKKPEKKIIKRKNPKSKEIIEEEDDTDDETSSVTKKSKKEDENDYEGPKKGGKKKVKEQKDKKQQDASKIFCNLTHNLYTDAPENVSKTSIQIYKNLIVCSKMIVAPTSATSTVSYDYPAICFVRKTKNDKIFEFNIPLGVLDKLVDALLIIKQENQKFFSTSSHKNV